MTIQEIFSLLGIILVLLLVLGGCYLFTRWAGTGLGARFGAGGGGARMKVVERLPVGRDQALLVVKAGQRYLLLGSTPAGLTLLAELTPEEGKEWDPPEPPDGPEQKRPADFRALMQRLREKK